MLDLIDRNNLILLNGHPECKGEITWQQKEPKAQYSEGRGTIPIHLVKISSIYKVVESVSFSQTTLNNIEYYYLYYIFIVDNFY